MDLYIYVHTKPTVSFIIIIPIIYALVGEDNLYNNVYQFVIIVIMFLHYKQRLSQSRLK